MKFSNRKEHLLCGKNAHEETSLQLPVKLISQHAFLCKKKSTTGMNNSCVFYEFYISVVIT